MDQHSRATGAIVEAVRLLVTLTTTAAGFLLADRFQQGGEQHEVIVFGGAMVGAGVGYVLGGVLGRTLRRLLVDTPRLVAEASALELFGGAFGAIAGVALSSVASVPLIVFLPPAIGWPLSALLVLVSASMGARLFAARAPGLARAGEPAVASPQPAVGEPAYVIDSSAAIDGRILDLARAGFTRAKLLVPEFVIDELQGIADSGERLKRRRGRRGLDVLDALRQVPGVAFETREDTVPQHAEVDAKLIALCQRAEATLVTTDHNLARAAELRGLSVLNPHALGEMLRPTLAKGDTVDLRLERQGSEPGQGVGFLEDGTMVVVEGGADAIGSTVQIEIANTLRTSVGRMMFAKLAT